MTKVTKLEDRQEVVTVIYAGIRYDIPVAQIRMYVQTGTPGSLPTEAIRGIVSTYLDDLLSWATLEINEEG